jgi:hypothetical protein
VIDPTIYTKPPSYIHPPIRKYNTFEIISADKFPDSLAFLPLKTYKKDFLPYLKIPSYVMQKLLTGS